MNNSINEYNNIITFIKELERLKDTTRTAWTKGGRRESTAEHTFRLAMFVLVLKDYFPEIDFAKALSMALVHDLGEAYEGDVSAVLMVDPKSKLESEERAYNRLLEGLSSITRSEIMSLFKEYNEGLTKESKLVKALDKIETIIQHNQGKNPEDFNYSFNLKYGKEYMSFSPIIKEIRDIVDSETMNKL
jgi:putative hydrolases of HD superfamily